MIHSAGKNCITLSAAAVGARGATQSNRVSQTVSWVLKFICEPRPPELAAPLILLMADIMSAMSECHDNQFGSRGFSCGIPPSSISKSGSKTVSP